MAVNYCYTDLSAKDSVYIEIEGIRYPIAQFTGSWAANEIPTAAVMFSLGRDARTGKKSQIHKTGGAIKQMAKATVWFEPFGEFNRGELWPGGKRKIFDGFFTGFAYRKISGKIHVIGNLIHWIAALGFSSSLTKNGHVSNPTALNAAAVLESLSDSGAATGNYVALLTGADIVATGVRQDLWRSIKRLFCAMAQVETMDTGQAGQCGGDSPKAPNTVALDALSRMEGPAENCSVPYKYGAALELDTGDISTIEDALATAIGHEFVESYASVTFWDKLVGQFCPMFHMAVVPMVDTAIVVADTPAFNGGFWKEIEADDYDSYDMTRELHRPLRAVGVVAEYASQTQAGVNGVQGAPPVGGCYNEDSVKPGDGALLYVAAPTWLRVINTQPHYASRNQGLSKEAASSSSTTPGASVSDSSGIPPTSAFGIDVNELYVKYAHSVFVNQMLRGQAGAFSGKLRFDIAPLSILKINPTSDKFIGKGQDDLAVTLYGCVQRVTVAINAEAGMAGTTFQLSHVRTDGENKAPRTSVDQHPLFTKASIHGQGKHGSPLIVDYDLFAGDGPAPPPDVA